MENSTEPRSLRPSRDSSSSDDLSVASQTPETQSNIFISEWVPLSSWWRPWMDLAERGRRITPFFGASCAQDLARTTIASKTSLTASAQSLVEYEGRRYGSDAARENLKHPNDGLSLNEIAYDDHRQPTFALGRIGQRQNRGTVFPNTLIPPPIPHPEGHPIYSTHGPSQLALGGDDWFYSWPLPPSTMVYQHGQLLFFFLSPRMLLPKKERGR